MPEPAWPGDARCLITGAGGGIGGAVARRLLELGVEVVAADVSAEPLAELREAGACTIVSDIVTPEGRRTLCEGALGATHIVNAAGVLRVAPIESVDEDQWDLTFDINAKAVFFICQLMAPRLPRGGAIVNVASIAARAGRTVHNSVYAASKAAVLSITRSFAHRYADAGLRVNSVSPGIIDTRMQERLLEELEPDPGRREEVSAGRVAGVALGRAGTADECAHLIVFLLSPAASYLTGVDVDVAGGLYL